jgi:hypothetical protein
VRVYIPTTIEVLAEYHGAGAVEDNERISATDESEEAEYQALMWAADSSADLLRGSGRRVVIVADGEGYGSVNVPIPMTDVVAVYVDVEDIDPASDELPELAWFASQEIPELLR